MIKINPILKFDLNALEKENERIRKHNEMIHFFKLTRPENYIKKYNQKECIFNNDNDNNDNNNEYNLMKNKPNQKRPYIYNQIIQIPQVQSEPQVQPVNYIHNHYHVYVEKCKKEQENKKNALRKLNDYLENLRNNDNNDIKNIIEELNNTIDEFNNITEEIENNDTENTINENKNVNELPYLDNIDDENYNFSYDLENEDDTNSDDDDDDNNKQLDNDIKYVKILLNELKEINEGINLSNRKFQKISEIVDNAKL